MNHLGLVKTAAVGAHHDHGSVRGFEDFPCHCHQVLDHGGHCWVSIKNIIESTILS